MRLMWSSPRLPSGGKARGKAVLKDCVCSDLLNRWFAGSQGIVGSHRSSRSCNSTVTVCVGERKAGEKREREADGCLTVADGRSIVLSLLLSPD